MAGISNEFLKQIVKVKNKQRVQKISQFLSIALPKYMILHFICSTNDVNDFSFVQFYNTQIYSFSL